MTTELLPFVLPYGRATVKVQVFFLDGHEPFICGVCGQVTTEHVREIEQEICESGLFTAGSGDYLFECRHVPGQYGEFGMCEFAPGWEVKLIGLRSLEDEAFTEPEPEESK